MANFFDKIHGNGIFIDFDIFEETSNIANDFKVLNDLGIRSRAITIKNTGRMDNKIHMVGIVCH